MERCWIDNKYLQIPSVSEWEHLLLGQIQQIDGYPVIPNKFTIMAVGYAFKQGAAINDKVIPYLELRKWVRGKEWVPSLFYYPQGCPSIEHESKQIDEAYIQVYFRKFHCFDCGIDMDAYAIENDAYSSGSYKSLNKIFKLFNLPQDRCPRCEGNVRKPGIVEIVQTYDNEKQQ